MDAQNDAAAEFEFDERADGGGQAGRRGEAPSSNSRNAGGCSVTEGFAVARRQFNSV